jgi:cell division control protein 7
METTRARDSRIPFEIHEDRPETDNCSHDEQYDLLGNEGDDQDQDEEQDRYSEASDESDGVVDEGVLEDMERLQDTFKGIKDRFRLINRIGEGLFCVTFYSIVGY